MRWIIALLIVALWFAVPPIFAKMKEKDIDGIYENMDSYREGLKHNIKARPSGTRMSERF